MGYIELISFDEKKNKIRKTQINKGFTLTKFYNQETATSVFEQKQKQGRFVKFDGKIITEIFPDMNENQIASLLKEEKTYPVNVWQTYP